MADHLSRWAWWGWERVGDIGEGESSSFWHSWAHLCQKITVKRIWQWHVKHTHRVFFSRLSSRKKSTMHNNETRRFTFLIRFTFLFDLLFRFRFISFSIISFNGRNSIPDKNDDRDFDFKNHVHLFFKLNFTLSIYFFKVNNCQKINL